MSTIPMQMTRHSVVVGRELGLLRRERRIPQQKIADVLGITQGAWSRIEKGDSALSIDQLYAAAGALGVNPVEILERTNETEKVLRDQGIGVTHERDPGPGQAILLGAALGLLLTILLKRS